MIINDGQRALAYNTTIDEIRPIAGADNIEEAIIGGWHLIVRKGEFIPGSTAIYFEVDSKLPEDASWAAFLAPKHFKVKTMKLSKFGVISQGLALPIETFDIDTQKKIADALDPDAEHTDLTAVLGVTYAEAEDNARKSDAPALGKKARYQSMVARHKKFFAKPAVKKLMRYKWFRELMFLFLGKKKDNPMAFPSGFPYVHKTDEERIQNLPNLLGYENPLIVTEKIDGTSCTFILERKKGHFGKESFEFYVSSRNVRQLKPDQACYHDTNIYWELALKYDIENHLKEYLDANPDLDYVCIQGEGAGSVQGNPLKLKDNLLFCFNFIRSDVGRLPSDEGEKIVHKWGMMWVPILDTAFMMPDTMEEILSLATAKSVVNPAVLREGIVLRDPTCDLSFKAVSNEYLLKHGG